MEVVGFVPEPNCGRGTIGILWNCFSTLFLAIWVSCHPGSKDPDSQKSWLFTEKMLLCAISFVVPEVGAAGAMHDMLVAQRFRRDMRKVPGWDRFSLKQSFLVPGIGALWGKEGSRKWKVSEENLVSLASAGHLSFHDFPSDAEIDDRSKSSGLLKVISISQTIWFMVNVAYRLKVNYYVTLLEDLTVAHAFCGLVMFLAYFRCPQDIHSPFLISTRPPTPSETGTDTHKDRYELNGPRLFTIAAVLFAIFAGIHIAAWHYPYATTWEAWVWRVCSVLIFCVGAPCCYVTFVKQRLLPDVRPALFWIILGSYTVIRLALVVVALMAFRRAPASIYDIPTWSAYWIHFG